MGITEQEFTAKLSHLLDTFPNALVCRTSGVPSLQMSRTRQALRKECRGAEMLGGRKQWITDVLRTRAAKGGLDEARFRAFCEPPRALELSPATTTRNDDVNDNDSQGAKSRPPRAPLSGHSVLVFFPKDVTFGAVEEVLKRESDVFSIPRRGRPLKEDLVASEGYTGLDPGYTHRFVAQNVATKIQRGEVFILKPTRIACRGEAPSDDTIDLARRLGLKIFVDTLVPDVLVRPSLESGGEGGEAATEVVREPELRQITNRGIEASMIEAARNLVAMALGANVSGSAELAAVFCRPPVPSSSDSDDDIGFMLFESSGRTGYGAARRR